MKAKETLIILIVVVSALTTGISYVKFIAQTPPPVMDEPYRPTRPVQPEVVPEKPKTFEEVLGTVTAEDLKEHVYFLADDKLEGRGSGEPGGDAARDYIKAKLESYGLPTELDEFRVRTGDKSAENVYGWIEGTENPDEVIVIGAHYDHLGVGRNGVFNGADDNASGTAAVLEMAEALSQIKDQCKRTIVFQLYSGEELGLVGSTHYVGNPTFPKSGPSLNKHIFMENLDMIGYLPRLAQMVVDDRSPVDSLVSGLKGKYPFAARVTKTGGGGSDHAPFYRRDVPAVFMHTGTGPSPYHQVTDDADKLNYNGMEGITKYGLELVWQVCEDGLTRRVIQVHEKNILEDTDLDHGVEPFWK